MDSSEQESRPVPTMCKMHDHSLSPVVGSSTPHYKDGTMRIQNGFEGFILVQRTPEESQNKRTCWFKCLWTLECRIAWPTAVPFYGMMKRLQSADRHHLCWTHLPDPTAGFCMHMLILNSCFLTALSCSKTRWSWWKGTGNLQTRTRDVSIPRL